MEELRTFFDSVPFLGVLLCGFALIIVATTALVVLLMAGKEQRVGERLWNKVGNRMELYDGKRQYPLAAEEILLGRHAAADIRFADIAMSRYHALLTVTNGVWYITDLHSAGGTFVNGRQVHSARLTENDRIKIGGTLLYLRKRS